MQGNTLNGMRVAILVTDDFEQAELVEPKKALEQAGATTKIISPKPGQVQGMNHDVKADTFPVDMTLDQANPGDFDAILLPGGAVNADALRMEPKAQDFVRQIESSKTDRTAEAVDALKCYSVTHRTALSHRLSSRRYRHREVSHRCRINGARRNRHGYRNILSDISRT